MSSRQKKPKAEKKVVPKAVVGRPARPAGRAPVATVVARHGQGEVTRPGRGFSVGELSSVALSPHLALRWGVRLDSRRRSVLQGNVDSLKAWVPPAGAARREGRVREIEEEVEKVGREIKEEAVRVEKDIVKVEEEVKEEAKKAEKAVKRRAGKAKPKTKPRKKAKS